MSEEEENENEESTKTGGDTDNGNDSKVDNIIDRATETAERIEAANKKTEELMKKQEQLAAQNILGGQSQGSPITNEKDISPVEYSQLALKGLIEEK
jgi:hypothetical protein